MVLLLDLPQHWPPLQSVSLASMMSLLEILVHQTLAMTICWMCCRKFRWCRCTRDRLPRIFPRLCHCLNRFVVRPNAFERHPAPIRQCMNVLAPGQRLCFCIVAHMMPTDLVTFCEFIRYCRNLCRIDLSVGIRDEVFAGPLRIANSRTTAFLELALRPPKHLPGYLVRSLDHLSSVRTSMACSECHITVDFASVPVQQPRSVSSDSPDHKTARNHCCTPAG